MQRGLLRDPSGPWHNSGSTRAGRKTPDTARCKGKQIFGKMGIIKNHSVIFNNVGLARKWYLGLFSKTLTGVITNF